MKGWRVWVDRQGEIALSSGKIGFLFPNSQRLLIFGTNYVVNAVHGGSYSCKFSSKVLKFLKINDFSHKFYV